VEGWALGTIFARLGQTDRQTDRTIIMSVCLTRVNPKIRGPANLAGAWRLSRYAVPASPPRAVHSVTGLPPRVPRARRRGAPAATPRPRQQPLDRARTRAAGRGEGYRRHRPPNDGQAAADDARPRPPEDAKVRAPAPCGGAAARRAAAHLAGSGPGAGRQVRR
jgi:hypothetical protein